MMEIKNYVKMQTRKCFYKVENEKCKISKIILYLVTYFLKIPLQTLVLVHLNTNLDLVHFSAVPVEDYV